MSGYRMSFRRTLGAMGERARQLRLIRGFGQEELAARSSVAIATIRRFEGTGIAGIENILRIATALDAEGAFTKLFEAPAFRTLDEAIARPAVAKRKRAARRT